jgi:undecaprenyl-diphosphatase
MNDFQAAVLGFIQGATEFIPISSTAHLRIIPSLLGWEDPGAAFTAVIQWGTLLAALVYFRKDILNILLGNKGPKTDDPASQSDQRLLVPILVGTIPIVVLGLLLKHKIEHEFRGLTVIAVSMIGFAILLGIAEQRQKAKRQMGDITVKDGLIVGIAQAFSLIPGASRSGTTITGALFIGLERSTAARFSFLLGLPAIFGAGAKELYDAVKHKGEAASPYAASAMHARPLIIAIVVAFIVGWFSIDWLLKFLRKNPTYVFIVYRIIAGLAILALASSGRIH